jgi:hypothetical protein
MRKVMLLAAMLAMVLVAAAPAFAQSATAGASAGATAITGGGSDDGQYNANAVCQNIIGSIGDITQTQSGDADAVAVDDSAAAADVAQEQGVTINQVNDCLNTVDLDDDGFITPDEHGVVVVSVSASASASAPAAAAASPSASASAAAVLPETGGASLIALGAGALLVAGGLLARRIVR